MTFDGHANLAISAIAVAPNPATTGTVLQLNPGDYTKYAAVPFNCTIVTPNGSEIVRMTAFDPITQNYTILRGQEGTTAQPITVGSVVVNSITKKVITDIENAILGLIDQPVPQVYPNFGVNYQNKPQYVPQDIAYFKRIGLRNIRVTLVATGGNAWSVGTADGGYNYATYRLVARMFANAGFFVTVGPSGNGSTMTAATWPAYHDWVVAEAAYMQSIGMKLAYYEIGNELEFSIDQTTLTYAQLNANLRQLALDVKAVYNLGGISYGMTLSRTTAANDWLANGLGGLDVLNIHAYGVINTSTQTVSPSFFASIASFVAAFGDRVYVGELVVEPAGGFAAQKKIIVDE